MFFIVVDINLQGKIKVRKRNRIWFSSYKRSILSFKQKTHPNHSISDK